ncbi:MAG: PIN domain-containing protein [Bacteroidales bacterium]|nr:PIN domain-containing protein [Bacteroidales bacterium]
MNKFALDTNILVYSHDDNAIEKQNIARDLIVRSPIICSQTLAEYVSVLRRVIKMPKAFVINACMPNLRHCQIKLVDIETLQTAERLLQHYDFQIFDAIIVASALEADCNILYSEDMKHNMKIDRKLSIINPFL